MRLGVYPKVLQKIRVSNGQFVLSREIPNSPKLILVPGYGQSAEGSYYLLSQLFYSMINEKISLFCFDYCNCGDSLTFKNIIEWDDYLNGLIPFLVNKERKKVFILTGMSMLFEQKILRNGFQVITIPPYPSVSKSAFNFIELLENELYDTDILYSLCPSIRFFFESLGASWNEWKGLRVSKNLLQTLSKRTKEFSKKRVQKESLISFEIRDNLKMKNFNTNIKYLTDSYKKYGVLSPKDRRIIQQEIVRKMRSIYEL